MASWYETRIDRQLREAQEHGDFENLPGSGKPLPNNGEEYDDEWWIKALVRRESLAGAGLPPALALRKEVEDLRRALARKHSEAAVRRAVVDLNDRIMLARRGPVDGPPVAVRPVDIEAVVRAWRSARDTSTARPAAVTGGGSDDRSASVASRRRWWSRRPD